jgi:hypothetical protein
MSDMAVRIFSALICSVLLWSSNSGPNYVAFPGGLLVLLSPYSAVSRGRSNWLVREWHLETCLTRTAHPIMRVDAILDDEDSRSWGSDIGDSGVSTGFHTAISLSRGGQS